MFVVGQWHFKFNLVGRFWLVRLEVQTTDAERFAGSARAGFSGRRYVIACAGHCEVFRHVSLKGEGFGWGHGTARHHQSQSAQAQSLPPFDGGYQRLPIRRVYIFFHFLMCLFSAVGINSAIATVGHFERLKEFIRLSARLLILSAPNTCTGFPPFWSFNPPAFVVRLFNFGHAQHQLDCRVRQLIAMQAAADHAFFHVAVCIQGSAHRDFYDVAIWAHSSE